MLELKISDPKKEGWCRMINICDLNLNERQKAALSDWFRMRGDLRGLAGRIDTAALDVEVMLEFINYVYGSVGVIKRKQDELYDVVYWIPYYEGCVYDENYESVASIASDEDLRKAVIAAFKEALDRKAYSGDQLTAKEIAQEEIAPVLRRLERIEERLGEFIRQFEVYIKGQLDGRIGTAATPEELKERRREET